MTVPQLRFVKMFNMAVGFLGVQFAWSIQVGQMSGLYERLGATPEKLSWLWVAAPLTGLIVQPIVGYYSDRTWCGLGRRRPYFLAGAILSSLALIAMPNSTALWMATGLLWILDASINITMQPLRAFVADLAPENQRGTAYSFQSWAIGVGSVLSFGIGSIVFTSFHALFYIGAAVFMVSVLWTTITTKEHPPENLEEFRKRKISESRDTLSAVFVETWRALFQMSQNLKCLCVAHSFTWFAFFCVFVFFSPMVATHIFCAEPNTPGYDQGIAWASFCLLWFNVTCFVISPIIGFAAKKFKKTTIHIANLLIGVIAFIVLYLTKDKYVILVCLAAIGITWASTLSMPYAILSGLVPKERYGLFMGMFNIFVCLPQILCAVFMGLIVNALGGNKAVAMLFAAAALVVAVLILQWVREKDEDGVPP